MEAKLLEVFSEQVNFAIVRMPGRNYPGCVIQGDSLSILCRTAARLAEWAKRQGITDEQFLGDLEDLHHALLGRLLDYQEVLQREGMDLPFTPAIKNEDFIRLTPPGDE